MPWTRTSGMLFPHVSIPRICLSLSPPPPLLTPFSLRSRTGPNPYTANAGTFFGTRSCQHTHQATLKLSATRGPSKRWGTKGHTSLPFHPKNTTAPTSTTTPTTTFTRQRQASPVLGISLSPRHHGASGPRPPPAVLCPLRHLHLPPCHRPRRLVVVWWLEGAGLSGRNAHTLTGSWVYGQYHDHVTPLQPEDAECRALASTHPWTAGSVMETHCPSFNASFLPPPIFERKLYIATTRPYKLWWSSTSSRSKP